MYYIDGELVTVGTKKGKSYLNSHPAILATFQSQCLYGKHLDIIMFYHPCTYSYMSLFADDFQSKLPTVSDAGNAACRTSNSNASTSTTCISESSTVKNSDSCSNASSSRSTDTGIRSIVLQSAEKKQGSVSKVSALLKNSNGIVVAAGDIVEGQQLHGESLREGCVKVMITDVVTPEAKSWFPDKFGEDTLGKGTFVEWPKHSITHLNAISPLATRSSRRNMKMD